MSDQPIVAITAGEPAGIGPELVARVAEAHRERPFPARLIIIGDRSVLAARAARIGLSPRYADYSATTSMPTPDAIEVWDHPVAVSVSPGHPDRANARSVLGTLT